VQVGNLLALLALAAGVAGGGCAQRSEEPARVTRTIEQSVAARTPELMRIEGVVGVGQGVCNQAPCIRVFLATADAARRLPQRLDGYLVSPVVTGIIRSR